MTCQSPCQRNGFTLIEVLVALAVLAIALSAVIGATVHMADNASYINKKTLAMLVAHNRLARYELSRHRPDSGTHTGHVSLGNRRWKWRSKVSKTQDSALRRVEVKIMPRSSDQVLATLNGFFAARKPQ
jgi:general secretion pathway protein I